MKDYVLRPLGRYGHSYKVSQRRYYFYIGYSAVLYSAMGVLIFAELIWHQTSLHLGDFTTNTFAVVVLLGGFGLLGQIKIASRGNVVPFPLASQPTKHSAISLVWMISLIVGEVFLIGFLGLAVLYQTNHGLPLPVSDAVMLAVIIGGIFSILRFVRRR